MPAELDGLREALGRAVGEEHVLRGSAAAALAIDGAAPRLAVRPGTQAELQAVMAAAAGAGAATAARGSGSALGLGHRPARLDLVVCLDRLCRIVALDPANLVVTVEAGVRLGDLHARLAGVRQLLGLDPPRLDRRTVGGVLATNASGPGRLRHGTARDLVLGLTVVLAGGERVRCGGRVIKNVSGYDLNKLFIGSLGTLGVISEATFKLLPAPAARAAVAGLFPGLAGAAAAVARLLRSSLLPESVDLLDARTMARLGAGLGLAGTGYGLVVGVAGSPETVERQACDLERLMAEGGAGEVRSLREAPARAAGALVREALEGGAGRIRVKLGVPIGDTGRLFAAAEALGERRGWSTGVMAHAGSGILRATYGTGEAPPEAVADALEALRGEAEALEGSLVVEAAPPAVKSRLDPWGKPGDALAVMRRLKAEFDPASLLNPGRFLGGI